MKAIDPGVEYALQNFNSEETQSLRFVAKKDGQYQAGTTNEEVINMLIDRFYHLQKVNPSSENQIILNDLKRIRQMLAKRLSTKIANLKRFHGEQGTT